MRVSYPIVYHVKVNIAGTVLVLDIHISILLNNKKTNLPSLHPVIALHCSAEQIQVLAQDRPYLKVGIVGYNLGR